MPRGCVVHIPQIPYSHWCIPTPLATIGIVGVLYISAWGFGVARFDKQGILQPLTVKRATVQGFTLFLCLDLA